MPNELVVRTHSIIEIRCSFCTNHVREDVKCKSDDPYDNQQYHFREGAKRKGWGFKVTNEENILNLCPEHADTFEKAELL